jgi:hypothetical protein
LALYLALNARLLRRQAPVLAEAGVGHDPEETGFLQLGAGAGFADAVLERGAHGRGFIVERGTAAAEITKWLGEKLKPLAEKEVAEELEREFRK